MRKQQPKGVIVSAASAAEARHLARAVKASIDDGSLDAAELLLAEARHALGDLMTGAGREISLTLMLEEATIVQYRGDSALALQLASSAVEFADETFGPRGIHVGRARLRRNFALEAGRDFARALRANLELADELASVSGGNALRLNCFTRALACAVKNADRTQQQIVGEKAEPLWRKLNETGKHEISRWFLYWCAIALLRQLRTNDAEALMANACNEGPEHWRWKNAALFAYGYGLTLHPRTETEGQEILRAARDDAERRGFFGLIRSIDAGLTG